MQIGVIIREGLQDFQIIQQKNGVGDISISGIWIKPENIDEADVLIRVVSESTGDTVIPWIKCDKTEDCGWNVVIRSIPAGGLYRIETCLNHEGCKWEIQWATRGDMIHHVGVGDIYVIAGQSNSAGYGKDPINDPPEIGLHILRNSGKWDLASHPLNESTNTVHEENREGGNPGHSPYMNFARILKRELGYPIGLVQTSLGGTPLSMWNPAEDGLLYKNMLNIIKTQVGSIKGVLWYQGCSDTSSEQCVTYLQSFENMVSAIRHELGDENLPFLTVQINRCLSPGTKEDDIYWGKIREAQRQAAKKIQAVYVVPSIDCTMSDGIHNTASSNMVLGERLAKAALSQIYRKKYLYRAPEIVTAVLLESNRVQLNFENVFDRLDTFEQQASHSPFTIIDEEGQPDIVEYFTEDKTSIIITFSRELKGKGQVHGAYEMNPKAILPIDRETHMPILAFYGIEIIR